MLQLDAKYKAEGALGIGSHYVIDRSGTVHKGRARDEHPNVHPRFNKDSVVVEVMCNSREDMTPIQKKQLVGVIETLKDAYPTAEELDHTL